MGESDFESRARVCDRIREEPRPLGVRTRLATLLGAALLAATPLCTGCSEQTDPELAAPATQSPSAPERKRKSEQEKRADWQYRLEKKREWWDHARAALFADIELSDEQARAVDAIIGEQLATRERLQQSDAEVQAARAARDAEGVEAARANSVAVRAQLKDLHEIYEELRALLRDEQRPAFDLNRARHVAESRSPAALREPRDDATSPATTADDRR
jgi:hypothetical protein